MSISEITTIDVANYLRIIYDDEIESELGPIMEVAKNYIISYTGIAKDEIDEHEDFYYVFMILCSHMYDNRCLVVDSKSLNMVVTSILDMHSRNLVMRR